MERRADLRIKKRLSCELRFGQQVFNGLVLDLSSHGLFVQTAAKPEPGRAVHVSLSPPGRSEPLAVDAVVAWAKLVPPQLRTVAQGGLGLHIPHPTPEFGAFLDEIRKPIKMQKVSLLPHEKKARAEGKELSKERLDRFFGGRARPKKSAAATRGPEASARLPRWRVQLQHAGGDGSRSFIVRCETEDEALQQVLAEIDDDWQIEGVQRV